MSQHFSNNTQSDPTVRTHSALLRYKWARVWYYCRAHDPVGFGAVELSWGKLKADLRCHASTLYGWLNKMQRVGAVRAYWRKGDRLRVYLGGLFKVTRALGLMSWGVVAELPLSEILGWDCKSLESRATATALVTQQLQNQSRYAARRCQKDKKARIPSAEDVLQSEGRTSSRHSRKGSMAVPRVLHVGKRCVFVSKGFVPFGVSQRRLAQELGVSERTIRRHHDHFGVERRQMCQAKAAYSEIATAMDWEAEEWNAGDVTLYRSHLSEPHSKRLQPVSRSRFFSYAGKTWLRRTNLYQLRYSLTPMRSARRSYKNLITQKGKKLAKKHKDSLCNSGGAPRVSGISKADLGVTLQTCRGRIT